MPKYSVTILAHASKHLGVFEADTEEEAIAMAEAEGDDSMSLCHQCSVVDIGDIYQTVADEID